MSGHLARRRIHLRRAPLLAGAVVLTLLAALFASPAPAQAAEGDLDATNGWCVRVGGEYVMRSTHHNTENSGRRLKVQNAAGDWVDINCPRSIATLRVNMKPNGTVSPDFTIREPTMRFELSDAYVQPGTTVSLTFQLIDAVESESNYGDGTWASGPAFDDGFFKSAAIPDATLDRARGVYRLNYLHTSGVLSNPPWPPGQQPPNAVVSPLSPSPRLSDTSYTWRIPVPLGTPPGEYTISASVTWDEFVGTDWPGYPGNPYRLRTLKNEVVLHVVEELPVFVAESSIALGNAREDDPRTLADEFLAEDGTEPADGGDIVVRITTLDADGEQPEDKRITQIQVFAEGGGANGAIGSNTISGDDALAQTDVTITKPDVQAGTVEVYAIVIGQGGVVETEPIVLTFTGPAATLTLGDDVRVGQPAEGAMSEAELSLSATDAAGNDVPPGTVSYQVTDADGNAVSGSMVSVDTSTAGVTTTTSRDDSNAPIALVSVSPSAEPGAYTITASLPGVDDSADTATVHVAGPTANLEVSADPASGTMVSEVITVTAMVTDAAGVAVADGEAVTFTLTGGPLVLVGADADGSTAGHQSLTNNGAASAKFVVIGSGTAVIAASSGGQSAVVVVASDLMAVSEEAAAEQEVQDCLSGTVGLVSWTCSQEGSAAAVMPVLAARGATALYLYNGLTMTWTGYAMVDGKVIIGSLDFPILEGDILYISY